VDFKKIWGKISKIRIAFTAFLCGFGSLVGVAFAETTIDLTILTDLLPTIVTLMVFSMIIGMLKKFGDVT
jgi:hypothetical protein